MPAVCHDILRKTDVGVFPAVQENFIMGLARQIIWLVLSLFVASVAAQEPPKPQTLSEAEAQRQRASAMRKEADQRYEVEADACYRKILVNQCLEEAQQRRQQTIIDARNLDLPAREFQREARRGDFAAKEARRQADEPQRQAKQQEQGDSFRQEEAERAALREQKLADKAKKAEKNRQKAAADHARRQEKAAKRAEKDTKRASEKAKREAREAGKP